MPGFALNCVGATKAGYETITGQFAIEHKICAEPREDPLLTVVSATIEKGAVVQAIAGPFDLGRPLGLQAGRPVGRRPPEPEGAHEEVQEAQALQQEEGQEGSAHALRASASWPPAGVARASTRGATAGA